MASEALFRARIAHHTPGRVRLRFGKDADVAEATRRLEKGLAGMPGIRAVEARPASRSVIVHYNPVELELQHLISEGFPAAAVELLEESTQEISKIAGRTAVGHSVVHAVSAANERLERATVGILNLQDAFPLSLIGLGLRRLLQTGLEPVPWYTLLYYGYASFVDLHPHRPEHRALGADAGEILRRRYANGELSREEFRMMMSELGAATNRAAAEEGGAGGDAGPAADAPSRTVGKRPRSQRK